MGAATANTIEPSIEFVHEKDCDIVRLHLHGLKEEQLTFHVNETRVIKISLGCNKFTHVVSENCDTNKITFNLEQGILNVRLPKKSSDTPAKNDADRPVTKYKLEAETAKSIATTLKIVRQKKMIVAAVYYGLALAIFVRKMQAWFSKKDDN